MNSTLKAAALLACLAALPAAALNHEDTVAPLSPGKFAVACSNIEQDAGRIAQMGGTAADYWEGNAIGTTGSHRYITDVLSHPGSAFTFDVRVPAEPNLYPTLWLQSIPFAAIVCYPTTASNSDAATVA